MRLNKWKFVIANLRLPWSRIFHLAVIVVLLIYLFFGGKDELTAYFDSVKHLEVGVENAFIHSAYFFADSKSLGKNVIAMVATMHRNAVTDLNRYSLRIIGSAANSTLATIATLKTEVDPSASCEYITVAIHGNTIPDAINVGIQTRNGVVKIPLSRPKPHSPSPVIFCIAPLFAAEQWQSLLIQAHTVKYFGGHMHLYILSMIETYYQLAKGLDSTGLITIQAWLSVKFSQTGAPALEPMRHSELRNPAAAYTDCLLQYKESADFVTFFELEDFLFPVNSPSYSEEFERAYSENGGLALHYKVFEQQSVKSRSLEKQSIRTMLSRSIKSDNWRRFRTVVRPQNYNSTWTYYSTQATGSDDVKTLTTNAVLSFKQLVYEENLSGTMRIPRNPINSDNYLLTKKQMRSIDSMINETLKLPFLQRAVSKLPSEDIYTPLINSCFDKQKEGEGYCVSTKFCNLENNWKHPCRHSDGFYHSGIATIPYTYHHATEIFFTRNLGCFE